MSLNLLKPRSGVFTLISDAMLCGEEQANAFTLERSHPGVTEFSINKQYDFFICTIGMDDCADTGAGSDVAILLDGEDAFKTDVFALKVGVPVKLNVSSATRMTLYIGGNQARNQRVLFINPQLIKGTPPAILPRTMQPAISIPITVPQAATFVVDPNDLDKLAMALRKQVDEDLDLKTRLQDGRMAVATFKLVDILSDSVAINAAEDLTTSLVKNKFKTIERGQLDKVLMELKIQDSALIDPVTAQKIGQVTGCKFIIVGSISDRGQFGIIINARILDTATGDTLAAERVECRKIDIKR